MCPEDFDSFIDASNITSMTLQIHFLALEIMMRPWLRFGNVTFRQTNDQVMRNTLRSFLRNAPTVDRAQFEDLVCWPLKYHREVASGYGGQ